MVFDFVVTGVYIWVASLGVNLDRNTRTGWDLPLSPNPPLPSLQDSIFLLYSS